MVDQPQSAADMAAAELRVREAVETGSPSERLHALMGVFWTTPDDKRDALFAVLASRLTLVRPTDLAADRALTDRDQGDERDTPASPLTHRQLLAAASAPVCASAAVAARPAFPLDAEQIVRLTGAVLVRVLNASRIADAKAVSEDEVIFALGDAAGVPLPVERTEWGGRRLMTYEVMASPSPVSPEQPAGGSHEG